MDEKNCTGKRAVCKISIWQTMTITKVAFTSVKGVLLGKQLGGQVLDFDACPTNWVGYQVGKVVVRSSSSTKPWKKYEIQASSWPDLDRLYRKKKMHVCSCLETGK